MKNACDDCLQVLLEFNLKMVALHIIDKDLTPEAPQHGRASAGIPACGSSYLCQSRSEATMPGSIVSNLTIPKEDGDH
jgi:hypothetical protein